MWLLKNLLLKNKLSGLCVPPHGGKGYALKHLTGAGNTGAVFIDLDEALKKESGAGIVPAPNISSGADRTFYTRARDHFDDIIQISDSTSAGGKHIVVMTRDYRLLKFLGIKHIKYFLSSQAYIDAIQAAGNLSDALRTALADYKSTLTEGGKLGKAKVLNTKDDLLQWIVNFYGVQQRPA